MKDLRRLFAYNRWANLRLLDALEGLTPDELHSDLKSSFPTPLATALHAAGAEWIWLERWKGSSPTGFPEWGTIGSVPSLRQQWDALWADQQAYLASLTDGDEDRAVAFKTFKGEPDTRALGDLMRHVVNHGTYHRGQLVTMLRQLGKAPPSTDFVRWLREAGGSLSR